MIMTQSWSPVLEDPSDADNKTEGELGLKTYIYIPFLARIK